MLGEQLECGFLTASGYWAAKRREPAARTLSDRQVVPVLERLHAANYGVYGVRKMWWLLHREGHQVGHDRVARLMRGAGLRGVVRGRKVFTTVSDPARSAARRPGATSIHCGGAEPAVGG